MSDRTLFERRFSCRRFTGSAVQRDQLERVLQAAIWAPSAGNLQPWRFVVVLDTERRQELAGVAHGQVVLARAPAVIVVCVLPEESARLYGDRGSELYCFQDTAAAAQNLMLAATDEGLGSCWVGAFDEAGAIRVLDLPLGWRPVAMIALGYAAEPEPHRSRRPHDEVVIWIA
jgi:nitroreductase